EIMETKSFVSKLHKVSSPDGDYIVVYKVNRHFRAFNYLMELKDGTIIYILVERRYPLSKELLQRMLDLGLEVEEESTAALHLLASPGLNSSWFSIHLVVYNEELAIPEQTATGTGISNPLMAENNNNPRVLPILRYNGESKPKSASEPLIEDWISDSEDENETEFKYKQRKPSFAKVEFVKSNEHVKIPRDSVKKVENNKSNRVGEFSEHGGKASPLLKIGEYEIVGKGSNSNSDSRLCSMGCHREWGICGYLFRLQQHILGPQQVLKMDLPSTDEEMICKKNDAVQKLVSRLVNSGVYRLRELLGANNDDKNLAFLTTSGASSTNNINTVNPEVSTGSQLVHEDLEQLHDDDLEEMDLKWNMALLSMRARKFYQRTGRKIIIDGSSTAGYDKSKVECFKLLISNRTFCQRMKELQGVKTTQIGIKDGAGFDWSDMAEEEIQANMALMAFSDSEVTNDKSCSKSCLKNYEALKKQYDDLLVKLDDTGFKASTYKRGLSILEGQILKYKESEILFSEEIALLKRSVGHKEYLMGLPRTELEKVKEEKGGGTNTPFSINLIQSSKNSTSGVREEEPKKARENNDAPIIEDWVSDDEDDVEPILKVEKNTILKTLMVVMLILALEGDMEGEYGLQMCDKKNYVLFTDTECLVLSPNFKLLDENQILLKIPRQDNMYSFDMKNIVPKDNKPMIEGNGPKWLFDLDSLTQSMNYVPVVAGKSSNDFAGIQGVSESSTSSQQDQDWIVMPIWKDASYFGDASPKIVDDAQIEDKDELHDEDDATEESHDGSSLKENGTVDQQVNTARPDINTGSREVSTALPEVNTATPEDLVGPSPASEDSHVEDQEIELGNIPQSYEVPGTPHTRNHKDYPIEHVIGDVLSGFLWIYLKVIEQLVQSGYTETRKIKGGLSSETKQDLCKDILKSRALVYGEVFSMWLEIEAIRGIVCQPLGKIDQTYSSETIRTYLLVQIYVDDISLDLQRRLCDEFEKLTKDKFQMSSMGELTFFLGLQFNYSDVKSASTPTDLEKPFVQDGDADDVDEHLYRSMIRSLMYLTASRPDIMFAVCACARVLVALHCTMTMLELQQVGSQQLVVVTFWENRLISWQCKKLILVATSTTEVLKYVAVCFASSCGQVTICIIENHVQHSKTKHIEIRHHFIRDYNAKKLIQMVKIDTDHNVADLLTKGFDAGRF
ncbi:hypothetical protein Tco_1476933, partial [Tanacetum coccineum]